MTNINDTIKLDYLSFTIPATDDNHDNIRNFFGLENIQILDYGGLGYTNSAIVLKTGRIFWHPERPEMKIHIRLPSSALGQVKTTALGMINRVLDWNGTFRRIDIAYDDFEGMLDIDLMYAMLRTGDVVTRWRKVSRIENAQLGGEDRTGHTVNVGSRTSESYLRIYDKLQEQKASGIILQNVGHWVRVELELKGDKSHAFGLLLSEASSGDLEDTASELCASLLYGMLDFKVRDWDDDNKSRWDTTEWWAKFIQTNSKLKLSITQKDDDMETSKKWINNAVGPTLAMIVLSGTDLAGQTGYDFIIECIMRGQERMTEKQKAKLDDYNAKMKNGHKYEVLPR